MCKMQLCHFVFSDNQKKKGTRRKEGNNQMKRRKILALLLSATMVMGMSSVSAFAEAEDAAAEETAEAAEDTEAEPAAETADGGGAYGSRLLTVQQQILPVLCRNHI